MVYKFQKIMLEFIVNKKINWLLVVGLGSIILGNFSWALKTTPVNSHYISAYGAILIFSALFISFLSTINIYISIIFGLILVAFYNIYISSYIIIYSLTIFGLLSFFKLRRNGLEEIFIIIGLPIVLLYYAIRFDFYYDFILYASIIPIITISMIGLYKFKFIYSYKIERSRLNFLIIFFGVIFLSVALLYSYSFDDLNNYFWVPKALIDGNFIFDENNPGAPTLLSAFALSTNFIIRKISSDIVLYNLYVKIFNIGLLVICMFFLVNILKYKFINNLKIFVCCVATTPFFIYEISGNFSDITIIVASLYVLNRIVSVKNDLNLIDVIFHLIWPIINFKTIPVFLAYWLAIFLLNRSRDTFIQLLVLTFIMFISILPLLALNYHYFENPTFPANNHFWRSEFFHSIRGDKIADKFIPYPPIDLNYFYNIFNVNPDQHLKSYWGGFNGLYGFLNSIAFLSLIVVLYKDKYQSIFSLLLTFIFLYCIFVTKLTGPEHRYFAALIIFLPLSLFIFIDNNNHLTHSFKFLINFSLALNVLYSINNSWFNLNIKYDQSHNILYTESNYKWVDKLYFYKSANKYIDRNDGVLLFYLQDRLFLNTNKVYENDWYSYPFQLKLREVIAQNDDGAILSFLEEKGVNFLILSANTKLFNDNFMTKHFTLLIGSNNQNLYRLIR